MHCIDRSGNSWKRMTCLDKTKMAGWSLSQRGNALTDQCATSVVANLFTQEKQKF